MLDFDFDDAIETRLEDLPSPGHDNDFEYGGRPNSVIIWEHDDAKKEEEENCQARKALDADGSSPLPITPSASMDDAGGSKSPTSKVNTDSFEILSMIGQVCMRAQMRLSFSCLLGCHVIQFLQSRQMIHSREVTCVFATMDEAIS